MELVLIRTYDPSGTNGIILCQSELIAYSIELPWKDNLPRVSCITEGRYELRERYSLKFNRHLQLLDVPGRDDILIHAANDALHELKGCIAPVSSLIGPGRGLQSRRALEKLNYLVYAAFEREAQVFLTIK